MSEDQDPPVWRLQLHARAADHSVYLYRCLNIGMVGRVFRGKRAAQKPESKYFKWDDPDQQYDDLDALFRAHPELMP